MKNNIIQKLTSRKFIVTAITAITGIITLVIGESEVVQTIAGAAMTLIPTVVYCLTEGVIDAKSIKTITESTVEIAEALGADDKTVDLIETAGKVGEVIVDGENGVK